MIMASEREKTVYASDRSATVAGATRIMADRLGRAVEMLLEVRIVKK
jgi:hypothetical protein